jgi:hypothetical protein
MHSRISTPYMVLLLHNKIFSIFCHCFFSGDILWVRWNGRYLYARIHTGRNGKPLERRHLHSGSELLWQIVCRDWITLKAVLKFDLIDRKSHQKSQLKNGQRKISFMPVYNSIVLILFQILEPSLVHMLLLASMFCQCGFMVCRGWR